MMTMQNIICEPTPHSVVHLLFDEMTHHHLHQRSTFASEMRATASALSGAGPSALILMDELGRGTSPTEGFGIAHAISERLYRQRAYVFFATHFLDLEKSLGSKSRLHTQHLSFSVSNDTLDASSHLMFRYKLSDGPPR